MQYLLILFQYFDNSEILPLVSSFCACRFHFIHCAKRMCLMRGGSDDDDDVGIYYRLYGSPDSVMNETDRVPPSVQIWVSEV